MSPHRKISKMRVALHYFSMGLIEGPNLREALARKRSGSSLPDGALKAQLAGHKLGVFGVAFSPDGQLLASASVDDTCRLWNPSTSKEIAVLGGHKGGAFNAAFSEDGRTSSPARVTAR